MILNLQNSYAGWQKRQVCLFPKLEVDSIEEQTATVKRKAGISEGEDILLEQFEVIGIIKND